MNKQVIHFCNIFIPYTSGTTVRIKNELLENNTHIIITEKNYENLNIENMSQIKNFTIHRMQKRKYYSLMYYLKKYKDLIKYAEDKINPDDIDIVYGHNPYEFAKASYKFSKKYKKKFIYEVHGCMYDSSKNIFRKILNKILEKKVLNYCDKIIVQTNNMKKRISKLYNIESDKICVVYNGINLNEDYDTSYINNIKRNLKLENNFIVGYFGHLDDVNGVDRILKLIDKYKNENIKFIFAGTGPLENDIVKRAKVNNQIIYLGSIKNNEIYNYYKILDLFMLPRPSTKTTENLVPMKLLEVMYAKIPILASDVNGIKEIINGNNAMLFNKNSDKDLIDKFDNILKKYNIVFNDNLLEANKEYVKNNFTWTESRKKIKNIISNI